MTYGGGGGYYGGGGGDAVGGGGGGGSGYCAPIFFSNSSYTCYGTGRLNYGNPGKVIINW